MTISSQQRQAIDEFCRRWHVAELWMFGSAARGEMTPSSDVDLMIRFKAGSEISTWDWPAMTDQLESIFGSRVDLLTQAVLDNPFRRQSILADRQVLFAA